MPPPIAYSYVRFSTPEQSQGDSFRRQTSLAEAYCERKGWTLSETTFRDLGVSAFRGKNALVGNLGEFLKAVKAGAVKPGSVLIVESLDRISRQGIDEGYDLVKKILKSGVRLVTLKPEREFDESAVKSLSKGSLEIQLILERAAEESERKSDIGKANWAEKRKQAKAGTAKLTARCPAWLRPVKHEGELVGFEPIPDRAAVVQWVYRNVAEGYGYGAMVKLLNREGVKPFGNGTKRKAKLWGTSSVGKLFGSRAVLGECQPHSYKAGKRVPAGEPVKGYFPPIVSDTMYYAAQAAKDARRTAHHGGQNGAKVTNLFTGLLRDARDGEPLHLVDKGDGPALVNSAARKGAKGSTYISFPYAAFEQSLIVFGFDFPLADVLPKAGGVTADDVATAEAKLADVTARLAKLKEKVKTAPDLSVLIEAAAELETERTEAKAALEKAKASAAVPVAEAAGGLKELLKAVKTATGDELYDLRLKLRRLLARLVEDITVLTVQVNNDRVAIADVKLKSGVRRKVIIGGTPGKAPQLPDGMESLDVRQFSKWPAEFKEPRFEVLSDLAAEMLKLEGEGLTRTEIAARLGVSKTQVTRTLLKTGARKQTRKPADDPRTMNWHQAGRGWVKMKDGQRYFIGVGRLKEMYPKLVMGKDAEGTWRAANRWWQDMLAGKVKG